MPTHDVGPLPSKVESLKSAVTGSVIANQSTSLAGWIAPPRSTLGACGVLALATRSLGSTSPSTSYWQAALHPSPLAALPSSQTSAPSMKPSPQIGTRSQVAVQFG